MSKKVKLIVAAMCCLVMIGFCISFIHYAFNRYMSETKNTIAKLEKELDDANEKYTKVSDKFNQAKTEINILKEENAKLVEQNEIWEAIDESGETETPTPTPNPTVEASTPTVTPESTITYYPGFPTEAVYTSGNGFLEIVGPDANGICTCRIWFNGNMGNDHYDFSGSLNIETATISFSDCTHTWESNGVDGTVDTVYTGGSGALVYVGNDTWRFDDHTGSPDGGTEFSYMMPYGHV